ncbi:MAG: hypothetical protein COY58_03915 [Gammaproteobacteria bacterium CG_4_10_14_0_8_um_filter_38_16]|nr:MAG: hypothetical protein COY58_03915 [Gammaproteobacteria bacterium CG_4_10_14_0_8_um_filter_38_16]PJA03208.1 MAG: hypothetical protein COX72_06440 [Gammaproteobacteria bacterium CG_4_10_14_0_2_um_filter_38_22]PJB10327.1 MAG: hypothetical protein CO120_05335 [Gammaproteobacteria bacterium CG_4_9_14_3_um_filter_38_9]
MQRLRKVLLILVLVIGIYLLLPFTFGIVVQRNATQFLKNENAALGSVLGIHLDLAQYNRGWFSSTAVVQVEKKAINGDMEILRKIPVRIEHGPSFITQDHFRTGLGMVLANDISLGDHSPYLISFRENMSFSGEHEAIVLLKTKENVPTNNLMLNSLVLNITSDASAKKYDFYVVGTGVKYNNPMQSLSLHIQKLYANLQADYLGKQDWKLTLGLGLNGNQLTAQLPDRANTALTVRLNELHLAQLHFDTKKMAKIVSEFIQLKQADDSQQPAKPAAWMALFQQLLTSVINQDTQCIVDGLKITTPMGELQAHYSASFPTLPEHHDYFDIATRDVGVLSLVVPSWTYTNTKVNNQFSLTQLNYQDDNNTVFSRHSKLTLGGFDMVSLHSQPKVSGLHIADLSYEGNLQGDSHRLSQTMAWQASTFCITSDCAQAIQGKLQLLNMDFSAFRGIAQATQTLVQPGDDQSSVGERWLSLGNAYAKLISSQSQVDLTHDMTTAQGPVQINGQLMWPNWDNQTAAPALFDKLLKLSRYHLHVVFPAYYVNTFITQQTISTAAFQPPENMSVAPVAPQESTFEKQVAQFLQYAIDQGYLKKVSNAYLIDLVGNGNVITINGVAWKAPK